MPRTSEIVGLASSGPSVRRILDDARTDRPLSIARVPTERSEVLAAAWELDRIAETLLTPGPVAASGVAQVRLLLINVAGPLFSRDAPGGLRAAATHARSMPSSPPSTGDPVATPALTTAAWAPGKRVAECRLSCPPAGPRMR